MTETRQALGELGAAIALLGRSWKTGQKPQTQIQAHAMGLEASAALPPADILEVLRRDLRRACDGVSPASVPAALLRRAPLVFWDEADQLAQIPGLLDAFLTLAMSRPRLIRTLIEAWLRDFGPGRFDLPRAGRAISRMLIRQPAMVLPLWREADSRFALFDAEQGPRRVAAALLEAPEEVAEVMRRCGMDDPLRAQGGFFRASVRQQLNILPPLLGGTTGAAIWARAVTSLETTTVERNRAGQEITRSKLRFAELEGDIAKASLAPWIGEQAKGGPKEPVKTFLVRHLGDPRIQPQRWAGAGEAATRLMRRWLADASLEAFLALISQSNDDPQWQYRQAFWRACFKRVPDAEVWIILGSALAVRADALRDLHGNFGRMRGADRQAVLLMRLGGLVLSEWSNVGPVRAWRNGDSLCPPMYNDFYDAMILKGSSLDFPNHPVFGNGGSHSGKGLWHRNGLWQGCAAELLKAHRIVNLQPADYMPGTLR